MQLILHKHIISAFSIIAAIAATIALYDILATDKEVEAGLKTQKKHSDLNFYDRRVEFAEIRSELYCNIKYDRNLCDYWRKQAKSESLKRQEFLRK